MVKSNLMFYPDARYAQFYAIGDFTVVGSWNKGFSISFELNDAATERAARFAKTDTMKSVLHDLIPFVEARISSIEIFPSMTEADVAHAISALLPENIHMTAPTAVPASIRVAEFKTELTYATEQQYALPY